MTAPSQDAELITRLRALVIIDEVHSNNPLGRDAADRLEALSKENERLRVIVAAYEADFAEITDATIKQFNAGEKPKDVVE